MEDIVATNYKEHHDVISKIIEDASGDIVLISNIIVRSLSNGGCVFWVGNGGSAADSQHLAAELVGRFKLERPPLRSIALTTDTSVLTCIANDYEYEDVFSRQIQALARPDDVLIGISTSGHSENVLRAFRAASSIDVKTIGLLGKDGGSAISIVNSAIVVPSDSTARIQEAHILIGHILCDLIERELGFV